MADALNLTPGQAGDVAAASEVIYSEAADKVLDTRTLGRDLLALVTIFLIVATFHMQNPLLQHGTQFGTAFRNETLRPVLAIGLAICAWFFVRSTLTPSPSPYERSSPGRGERRTVELRNTRDVPTYPPLSPTNFVRTERGNGGVRAIKLIAAVILAVYTVYILAAVLIPFNLSGALTGVDQAVFGERLNDSTPTAALESALALTTPLEWLALGAVLVLWQPWTRLPVYVRTLRRQSAPLIVAVLVLVLWEVLINVLRIQEFLLPRPSVIGATLLETYPRLISAGWNTFQNAFWGFAVGCGLGVIVGFVSARFIGFSRALLPLAVGLNAVPIIALAPIMNNWFGALNPASKIAIVALMTFFPAMISTIRGLTSVDPLSLELMKSYAAGQTEIFRKLRLPSALPFIFSAFKVATTLSMIGAIVSEYFGGSTAGLGYRIRDDAGLFKYPEAWSAIFVASLYGILFYLVVSAVERAAMPWHVSFREK
jgi:NitT/TauT family transport system permease protein